MGYQKDNADTKFYRAVRKYGKENFIIEQIDSATTQEELDEKEIYWIKKYDAINNGYNSKDSKGKCGGDTLSHHPNKHNISKKISESKKGDKNPMRIHGGLRGKRNGMFGKFGKDAPGSVPCIAISDDNKDIQYFDSLTELQRKFNVTTLSMITNRCKGRVKSPYKGYYFKYRDDYEKSATTIESQTFAFVEIHKY